jgi:sugar phosphate isomerase/epimerase
MSTTTKNEIFFSFFMFTADLRPNDEAYAKILIRHLRALTEMGYTGFDMHIAPLPARVSHNHEVKSYESLKRSFDQAGFKEAKFTTNVGTTRIFDPTSPYREQREQALAYLKSRVEITAVLGGESIMAGPFLYPYGVFPLTDDGASIWSDELQDWLKPRYQAAQDCFEELGEYAAKRGVKLAIEPVKSWETPGPNQVSDALEFLQRIKPKQVGVAVDTAQVVMESQGPSVFVANIAAAHKTQRLHYVHISAPDRGAVRDSWIPWDIVMPEILPIYHGPLLIEVFNAVPPFVESMRMSRRRFWRPGEDKEERGLPSAYDIAREGLQALQEQIARYARPVAPAQ